MQCHAVVLGYDRYNINTQATPIHTEREKKERRRNSKLLNKNRNEIIESSKTQRNKQKKRKYQVYIGRQSKSKETNEYSEKEIKQSSAKRFVFMVTRNESNKEQRKENPHGWKKNTLGLQKNHCYAPQRGRYRVPSLKLMRQAVHKTTKETK